MIAEDGKDQLRFIELQTLFDQVMKNLAGRDNTLSVTQSRLFEILEEVWAFLLERWEKEGSILAVSKKQRLLEYYP